MAGLIDGLVAVVGAALAGSPVSAEELIPARYRPERPPAPPADDEANRIAALNLIAALAGQGLR